MEDFEAPQDDKKRAVIVRPTNTGSLHSRSFDGLGSSLQSTSTSTRCPSRARSAPMLPAQDSKHCSNWYTSHFAGSDRASKQTHWRPLGVQWRERESDPASSGALSRHSLVRPNSDDQHVFMHGSIPHYGKGSTIRMKGVLAHEMTWAYYRMQKHKEHPLRAEVGDPNLPPTAVNSQMRSGVGSMFQFWRDLRPPFHIISCEAMDDPQASKEKGRLHAVTYLCSIDYSSERLWGLKSEAGTFDNKCYGVAQVRIPDQFPKQRPLQIASWGVPSLNGPPDYNEDSPSVPVDPMKCNPLADLLGKRADDPSLAACREAMKKAIPKKGANVPPMQRLLLAAHGNLNDFAKVENARNHLQTEDEVRGVLKMGIKAKARQHKVFTAAAGFVQYSG